MIRICPFVHDSGAEYLQLLVRGLADSAFIYFGLAAIPTDADYDLKIDFDSLEMQLKTEFDVSTDQDYFFSCRVLTVTDGFKVTMVFLDDKLATIPVYCDVYIVSERDFMSKWEEKITKLSMLFNVSHKGVSAKPVHFTTSLPAFLEFCRAAELIEHKEEEQIRKSYEHFLLATAYDASFAEAANVMLFYMAQKISLSDLDFVIDILVKANDNLGGNPRILLFLSEIYQKMRNNLKAKGILEQMILEYPDVSDGFIQLALIYKNEGKLQEAENLLQRRLKIDDTDIVCLDMLGAIYAGRDEHEKAEEMWMKALKLSPKRVNVLCNLGLLSEETEDFDKAEALYLKTLSISEYWCACYNFGTLCQRQGRFQESMLLLRKAVHLLPEHVPALFSLSEIYLHFGYFQKAQEVLLKVLQISTENELRCRALSLLDEISAEKKARWENKIQKIRAKATDKSKFYNMFLLVCYLALYHRSRDYWCWWSDVFDSCGMSRMSANALKKALCRGIDYKIIRRLGVYYYGKQHFRTAKLYLDVAYHLHNGDTDLTEMYLNSLVQLGEMDEYEQITKHIVDIKRLQEELAAKIEDKPLTDLNGSEVDELE